MSIFRSKSDKHSEAVFLPQKVDCRLKTYIQMMKVEPKDRILPIEYSAARNAVTRAGMVVGIHLRPHDLRRHAATYASRARAPLEIVRMVILRHANLSTTQRYPGKVSDTGAIQWIENVCG